MEMIYAAMLLHKTGQVINEENVKNVLSAAGAKVDETRIKAVVASLEGVNIDEAISKAATAPVAETKAEKKEEKKEEDTAKKAEEAAAGLGALFG